ncbi:carbohydrate sulfotransferase 5 [Biomphalaria pfeifferi]|uniref:Carbohydrate sulfotransferase 5 n=1 Tax=Biomphalaria pfeifferi TaxID=112525 RepID=A0AAD8FK81_BIOPF|nr:carbohydrate sulfotransferase 5 [Biomphalaria pfeifferi]
MATRTIESLRRCFYFKRMRRWRLSITVLLLLLLLVAVSATVLYYFSLHFLKTTINIEGQVNQFKSSLSNHHLILLTYMRSGSTFVGAMIGAHPDVFYMYEPLWTPRRALDGLTKLRYLNGSVLNLSEDQTTFWFTSVQVLNDIFQYKQQRTSDTVANIVKHTHMYRSPSTEDYAICLNISHVQDLTIKEEIISRIPSCLPLLTSACLQARVKLVKVIEAFMDQAINLMLSDPLVKVLHLIRDPRAVLISRKEFGFYPEDGVGQNSWELCVQILKDLELYVHKRKQFVGRLLTLRYEDIVREPLNVGRQLYQFVDLDVGPEFMDMIWNMTYAGFPDGCNVCPVRSNATVTAYKWRKKASFKTVARIQNNCLDLINLMGYRGFTSERELSSLHLPAIHRNYDPRFLQVLIRT